MDAGDIPRTGMKEISEACGVFGVYGHDDAARLAYYGLYALQHRGQESAGIAVAAGDQVHSHRGMGLVSEVFNGGTLEKLSHLQARSALGHVRYSTTGSPLLVNAQPLVVRYHHGSLALAHNGNLVNAHTVREELEKRGSIFQTTVDTEVIAHLIARGPEDFETAVLESLRAVRGGYALLLLTRDHLVAARDPHGIRPLSLGRLGDAHVLASETCAFETVGAETVREVEPGEVIFLGPDGLRSRSISCGELAALCVFEFIYFARPDSNLRGLNVHLVRKELGRFLAQDFPVEADLVTGVPDSSISAASGYAEEAGIPYEMGLIKNRYIGRTFIQPTQSIRSLGVKLKLSPIRKVVSGRRVVLVDDSIVRGTTSRYLVQLLRDAGATEVHLRIASPPYRFPCFYGIDTSARGELIASSREVAEIKKVVGADSLAYLSIERMVQAAGGQVEGFCAACFSGDYPTPVDEQAGKYALENIR